MKKRIVAKKEKRKRTYVVISLCLLISISLVLVVLWSSTHFEGFAIRGIRIGETGSGLGQKTSSMQQADLGGVLAPVGASLPGGNAVTFANGVYTLTYTENRNIITQYEIDTNSLNIRRGVFAVRERIAEQTSGEPVYPVYESGTRYRKKNSLMSEPPIWPTAFSSAFSPAPITTLTHSLSNGVVELRYRESIKSENVVIEKRYLVGIKGKTLILQVEALDPPASPFGYYEDFIFVSNKVSNPTSLFVSYAEFAPIVVGGPINNRYYLTTYFDYTKSNALGWPWLENFVNNLNRNYVLAYAPYYRGGQNGNYNALSETFYITLSNDINDVMPKINRNPSTFRDEMNKRVPLELWQIYMPSVLGPATERPFARVDTRIITPLKNYGLDDLIVTLTTWGHRTVVGTCGVSGSIAYPAEPSWGGSEQMIALSRKAQSYGYSFGLYQIYTDMFTTVWEPWNLVLERDGNWRNYGFINSRCPPVLSPTRVYVPQPLVIKPDKWMYYAMQDMPFIKRDYEVNHVFLDVHTKLRYPTFIDFDPDPSITARSPTAINQLADSLFNYLRGEVNGPIIGEGGSGESYPSDTLHAGLIEGVEGEQPSRKLSVPFPLPPSETPVIPDFEIRQIKPLMVKFGMGYATRWIKAPDLPTKEINILTYPWDKYHATQFAFGHSGYLNDEFLYINGCYLNPGSSNCWGTPEAWAGNPTQYEIDLAKNTINLWVKQYYISKAFQELYLASPIAEIKYLNPSEELVPLSQAIDDGVDFYNPRIYLRYQDGTEVWINRDQALGNIWAVRSGGNTYYLPANGWLSINTARNFIEYSALVNANGMPDPLGHRVDYVRSDKYIMANGRGTQTNFGNDFFNNTLVSTYMTVVKPNGWALFEQSNRQFRTGSVEYCGNNFCAASESCLTCSADCGICSSVCGNKIIETGEECEGGSQPCTSNGYSGTQTCSDICTWNSCTTTQSCGDNICNGAETCSTCASDCGSCSSGPSGSGGGGGGGSGGGDGQRIIIDLDTNIQQTVSLFKGSRFTIRYQQQEYGVRVPRATNEDIVVAVPGTSYSIPMGQKLGIDITQDGRNDVNMEYVSLRGNLVTLMFNRITKNRIPVLQEHPEQPKQPSEEWTLQEEQQVADEVVSKGENIGLKKIILRAGIIILILIAIFVDKRYMRSDPDEKLRSKSSDI